MAKTVYAKTSDVAQVWAEDKRRDELIRTGSNTWAMHGVLRSYGTRIASIVLDKAGKPVALISSHQYSSGTSKVQGEAAAEARRFQIPVFRVPHLAKGELAANVAYFKDHISEAIGSIERARDAESWRSRAAARLAEAERFASAFGLIFTYDGPEPASVLSAQERKAIA